MNCELHEYYNTVNQLVVEVLFLMDIYFSIHVQLDSAWIGYNKILGWETTSNWAGFLMAMGLQGYLSQLTPDRIYSITDKVCTIYCDLLYELCTLQNNHELTTIGLILGLAAEK